MSSPQESVAVPIEVLIGQLALIHDRIRMLDHRRLWSPELPGVAATEAQVAELERVKGSLPPGFIEFLKKANGWRGFYQWVDLFSIDDLLDGPAAEAELRLKQLEDDGFIPSDVTKKQLLPIGITRRDQRNLEPDVFALVIGGPKRGAVLWLASDLIDEYASFRAFLLAMIEYNRGEAAQLAAESAS